MKTIVLALIGSVIGVIVGLPMGVVGYGSGLGGEFIFGPLGLTIGLLVGLAIRRK